MHDGPIRTYPLTHDRLADFLAFFDGDAFSDNPEWSSCYCQCYYEDPTTVEWGARTAAQNRACASARIADGLMSGHLAYRQERVVGWCSAAPRPLLHALDAEVIRMRLKPAQSFASWSHALTVARESRACCSTRPAPHFPRKVFATPRPIRARARRLRQRTISVR